MAEETQSDITALTVQLLSAFVSNNMVPSDGLADLIQSTRAALLEDPAAAASVPAEPEYVPAVSIRKSIASPDHVLSLIDGRPYKTLKRHLATHGLTPEQYRERYNLPNDYPLVARSYSQARRSVAEKHGLGRKPVAAANRTSAKANDTPAVPPSSSVTKESAAPKKAPAAPARKPAKAVAAAPAQAATAKATSTAETKSAAAKPEPRKRLSIATPKDSHPREKAAALAPRATSSPAIGKEPSKKSASAAKTKSAAKPKTFKAALEAAGAHLNTDDRA